MPRITLPLAILVLGVLTLSRHVGALSAALYFNPTCYGGATKSAAQINSGDCFAVGSYGARITCTADGRVTQAALYESTACDIVFISGSGVGNGQSCITISSPRTTVVWGTVVDCSAPGTSSSSLSNGAIAGIVVGVVGGLIFVGLAIWCCRKKSVALDSEA